MYNVKTLTIGDMATNCYIVYSDETKKALIIDPADTPEYIGEKVIELGLTPVAMIATHGHFDHVLAGFGLQVFFPQLPFFIHDEDQFLLKRMQKTAAHFGASKKVDPAPIRTTSSTDFDGSILGEDEIKILPLAGHTPGSIGIYIPSIKSVFVGDLLFADGSVGETHHVYSDKRTLLQSIVSIQSLPEYTKVYAGHGEMILLADLLQKRYTGIL
jgi:hydroxyacylglutathione hydrolase